MAIRYLSEAKTFPAVGQRSRLGGMSDSPFPPLEKITPARQPAGLWRTAAALVLFALISAAAYTGWWFWLAGQVRAEIDAWRAHQHDAGRDVTFQALTVGGFPFDVAVAADDIAIVDRPHGWSVNVPALEMRIIPWAMGEVVGSVQGTLEVAVARGPAAGHYDLDAKTNVVMLDRADGGRVRVRLTDVVGVRRETGGHLSAEQFSALVARGSNPVFGIIELDAHDVTLPAGTASPFGAEAARLATRIELMGTGLPAAPSARALAAWSTDGGTIEVRRLQVQHGALTLNGEGTVALDGMLQPVGAFTARMSGYNQALDQLASAGLVRPKDGALAKIVLGVLAKVPPGGGPKQIEVPLTLQDRVLSVGPISLLRVPEIRWE